MTTTTTTFSTRFDTMAELRAHLTRMDKVRTSALRAAGFVKNANHMVCKKTGIRVSVLGHGDGNIVRWFVGLGGEVRDRFFEATVEDAAYSAHCIIYARDEMLAG